MKHILPTDLINEVLAYLSGKAFSEVNALISKIQQHAVPVPPEAPLNPPQSPIEPPVAE